MDRALVNQTIEFIVTDRDILADLLFLRLHVADVAWTASRQPAPAPSQINPLNPSHIL